MIHTTEFAMALAFGIGALALGATNVWAQETPPPPVIRILVVDASEIVGAGEPLPQLFIASTKNQWNPGATAAGGRFADPDGSRGWIFEVDAATARDAAFEFKFTRGAWDTVEVDDHGRDIGNRRISNPDIATHAIEVRLTVQGFADQRGSRFPAAPAFAAHPVTITGDVDVFTFHSAALIADRTVRVWLPPNYAAGKAAGVRYPVMYFCDGQNMFSRADNQFGVEWQADETADRLIRTGEIPALIMVGIDHSGINRAVDYNPPGTEFRGVNHHGDIYLKFLVDELMPEIARRYAVKTGADHTALGGSSFGGNFTLYAIMARPGVFSRALIESPAIWLADGALVKQAQHTKEWPERVFMAMGDAEYASTEKDDGLVNLARDLDAALSAAGLGPDRYRFVVEKGGRHHEDTWARRLPDALRFLWADRAE